MVNGDPSFPSNMIRISQMSSETLVDPVITPRNPQIRVYGRLPAVTKVVIKRGGSNVNLESLKLALLHQIVKVGMRIDLDICIEVVQVEPQCELGTVNGHTVIEFEETLKEKTSIKEDYLAVLENPKSSLDYAFKRLYEMVTFGITSGKAAHLVPRGLLLSGPPGVGKTHLVRRICSALSVPLVVINGPSGILSSVRGEAEENLGAAFEEASKKAIESPSKVCLLFLDEIDAIAVSRTENSDRSSVRLTNKLLSCMDSIASNPDVHVVVVGATNQPNALDSSLRRPGRFDREIRIDAPTVKEREEILRGCVQGDWHDIDYEAVARAMIGYVAADIAALYREAVLLADGEEDGDMIVLRTEHFMRSMKIVGPSLTRDYRVTVEPGITLDSIGGYEAVKSKIDLMILGPLRNPERYTKMGLNPPKGILLHGPPGCSKTTFAKAIANTSGCSFYALNGAAVFSSMVGESERTVRDTFASARMTAPSIIFVDEIDAMVGSRGESSESRDKVQERILSTFLNEMDGVDHQGRSVTVLGATNRPHVIDSALLRPGRFDYLLEIPLPNATERLSILRVLSKKMPLDDDVDLEGIATRSEGWSGAQLKNLLQEAALLALRRCLEKISNECIQVALAI